jgi:hypothetical protein
MTTEQFTDLAVKVSGLDYRHPWFCPVLSWLSAATIDGDTDGDFKRGALHKIYQELNVD